MKKITKEELIDSISNTDVLRYGSRKGNHIIAGQPVTLPILLTKIDSYLEDTIYELENRERMLGFDYEIPNKARKESLLIRTRL